MKISVILLDWSVRESFHAIEYLNNQNANRLDYELIWVEYFGRKIPILEKYYQTGCLDKYLILGHLQGDYHKHEGWNAGVLSASGDIVVLCDSDVIFKQSFIHSIIDFFTLHENSFLLIDEIRSNNQDFWPFSYPSWEEALAAADLLNWNEEYGVTNGLTPACENIPLWEKMFLRNYGACLCVRKEDYIRFGGLDEHESYAGYICGSYDLVVRMVNGGRQEHWHREEFLLHTWHPRLKPGFDRMGPHLWYNSTTSFKHLFEGNILPYVENKMIRTIRKQTFAEPPREGNPKFSVVVPKTYPRFIQRLYDSVKRSTVFPFEVIFIGDEDCPTDETNMSHLKSEGSAYSSILLGCRQAKGEIIVIAPYRAIFRYDSLDKLLDFQKKLVYPIVYLNAIETFTQGFIWQSSSEKFACDGDACVMAAFIRDLLLNDFTDLELRKIFSEGKKLSSLLETPAHLEIWHDDAQIINNNLEPLLTKMLELDNASLSGGENPLHIHEAENLLNQIYAEENTTPGNFLKYCFLKRYSLKDYYTFVMDFRRFNRLDSMSKGLELLVGNCSILTENINENIKEVYWSHKLIYSELAFYIASAHYHLAWNALERGNGQNACVHLKSCLVLAPGHEPAKNLLADILHSADNLY